MTNEELTEDDIAALINSPKQIIARRPAKGYRLEAGHKRCDMDLESSDETTNRFSVFIRQNEKYRENFSIGLSFRPGGSRLRTITLLRYNGPHGETSRTTDGHYALPHIHQITSSELSSGSTHPQESTRQVTDRYANFSDALITFFEDTRILNYGNHFPEIQQGQLF